MILPIGTPVTAQIYEPPHLVDKTYERITGTLHDLFTKDLRGHCEVKQDGTRYGILCITSSLRIRYDNPCPFTLWSWNTELKLGANDPWHNFFGDLNPESITAYRKAIAGYGNLS